MKDLSSLLNLRGRGHQFNEKGRGNIQKVKKIHVMSCVKSQIKIDQIIIAVGSKYVNH